MVWLSTVCFSIMMLRIVFVVLGRCNIYSLSQFCFIFFDINGAGHFVLGNTVPDCIVFSAGPHNNRVTIFYLNKLLQLMMKELSHV